MSGKERAGGPKQDNSSRTSGHAKPGDAMVVDMDPHLHLSLCHTQPSCRVPGSLETRLPVEAADPP
jgi:hypothetical protein